MSKNQSVVVLSSLRVYTVAFLTLNTVYHNKFRIYYSVIPTLSLLCFCFTFRNRNAGDLVVPRFSFVSVAREAIGLLILNADATDVQLTPGTSN